MGHFIFDDIEVNYPLKVLVVDRDRIGVQMIVAALSDLGHYVSVEAVKEKAVDLHRRELFDLIFVDPAPESDIRQFMTGIKRASGMAGVYTYVVLVSHDKSRKEAFMASANEYLNKPIIKQELPQISANVSRLKSFYKHMLAGEFDRTLEGEGPMLSRAGITQVFLSAVDRADRYGERAALLSIHWYNVADCAHSVEKDVLDQARKNLKSFIMRIRRRSDMLGKLGNDQYALIMQRYPSDNEPMEAINRFGASVKEFMNKEFPESVRAKLRLELLGVPVGDKISVQEVARD